jgi:PilZ domain-containing protein
MDASATCAVCGSVVAPFGKAYDRALVLSGSPCCPKCLPGLRFECHRCRRPLGLDDFGHGRAMVLLGHKYCDHCLEEAVEKRRQEGPAAHATPSPSPALLDESGKKWQAHRAHPRFLPPQDCTLAVHRTSVFGLLAGNVLRLWVDLSEGGLRAVLRGSYEADDRLKGTFSYPPRKLKLDFRGTVRYVKRTERFPGSMVVGLRFDQPSPELRAFLQQLMQEHTGATPPPRRNQIPKSRAG